MPAKFLLAVIAGVLTVLMVLLIAGHGPWAGHEIMEVTENHGLNDGDIPVARRVAPGAAVLLAAVAQRVVVDARATGLVRCARMGT